MVSNQITTRIFRELLFLNIDFQSLTEKLKETYFAHLEYSLGTRVFMMLSRVKRDCSSCLNRKGGSRYKDKELTYNITNKTQERCDREGNHYRRAKYLNFHDEESIGNDEKSRNGLKSIIIQNYGSSHYEKTKPEIFQDFGFISSFYP